MSRAHANWKGAEGGAPPLPSGEFFSDAGRTVYPFSFSCSGTGPRPDTYTFTIYHRTDNTQFYQYSVDGGSTWTSSIPVPGAPITGSFDWTSTITFNTSYLTDQTFQVNFRYRSVADIAATQSLATQRGFLVSRCARPVSGTLNSVSVYSCGNISNSGSIAWTSSPSDNVQSVSLSGNGISSTSTSGAITVTSANAGSVNLNVQSISGFPGDNFAITTSVINLGPGYNNPCNGFTATCGPVYETCECPSYGLCVGVGTCSEVRDVMGTCCGSGSISVCDGRCYGVAQDCGGNCPPYQMQSCSSGCPDACIPISSSCGPDPGCGTCAMPVAPNPCCGCGTGNCCPGYTSGQCDNGNPGSCPPPPPELQILGGGCSLGCLCPMSPGCDDGACGGTTIGFQCVNCGTATCSYTVSCNGAQTAGCGGGSGQSWSDCAFSGNFSTCAGCLFGGQDQSGSFSVTCSNGLSGGGGW